MLVSIDPGKKHAGVAVYEDGELSAAWLAKGTCWASTADTVLEDLSHRYPHELIEAAELAVEVPKIYRPSLSKGDPNDLVPLALMIGHLSGLMGVRPHEYLPWQWKGQVPKEIMCKRIEAKLSPEERSRVELPTSKKQKLDVWDAVGIGAHHERKRRR